MLKDHLKIKIIDEKDKINRFTCWICPKRRINKYNPLYSI